MSDIMEVPLPLAAVRFLMSFLTLKISICWSVSSSAVGMVANDIDVDGSSRWNEGGKGLYSPPSMAMRNAYRSTISTYECE